MSKNTLVSKELLAFQAISQFVVDANEVGGSTQRSLQLYSRLIEKTNLTSGEAIKKHISSFLRFCLENRESLKTQQIESLNPTTVEYSPRVYINIRLLLKNSSGEDQEAIWNHLMTISAIVDPEAKMKEVLTEKAKIGQKSENDTVISLNSDGSAEDDFIQNIMTKVETSVDPNSTDPSAALGQIMTGGLMTDMMSSMTQGMQDGSLDLGKMMGSLQKMVGQLEQTSDAPPELRQMTGNLNQMINTAKDQVEKHA